MKRVDVLIVGAGSAGATAAWKCAAAGLRVLLVDARTRLNVGACWVNGVEAKLFADLGMGEPAAPVLFHRAAAFHLTSPSGVRATCRDVPNYEIDMGALTADLLNRAEEAGAELCFSHRLEHLRFDQDVVVGARFASGAGALVVSALVTVDASGIAGAVRAQLPPEAGVSAPIPHEHLCVAAQQVREITDVASARRFLECNQIEAGETLCWSALSGGFSILNVSVDLTHGRVAFLTGAMRSQGAQAGRALIEEGVRRTGFSGQKLSGGGGLIPVRHAFDRLVGEGWALVGNAASQVFPAHGSGVAAGMRAAALLADALVAAIECGRPSTASLWPYAAAYQRGCGALCASQEWVRRLSERLGPQGVEEMFAAGLITGEETRASLACDPLGLSLRHLLAISRAGISSPRVAALVVAGASRVLLTQKHYERYPPRWSPRRFQRWRRVTRRLF